MSALPAALPRWRGREWLSALPAPELLLLIGATGVLNLLHLGSNQWANTYYSAAVRSMSSSWHNFLFAAMDPSGLMTVDKPPLSLWVQALSVRVFGFHPLSMLVPQALMGVVAVGLVYDLVRRRFGRLAAFLGGAAFALTPMTVAIARHNNPDELLVLCSVAAVWCAVRAVDTSRVRWLVLSGVCVGLGFETKMSVALVVVPGIVLAWMLFAHGRRIRGLAGFCSASLLVGGAWPLLVTLTPAADRPWIAGTSDNTIWSLIFGYNGLGRVSGQVGGPAVIGGGGGPNTMFGGSTGVFRLLHIGLGDQAGWLLGFALVAAVALLILTRLKRNDPRSGWLVIVGSAFIVTAVLFSFAHGIFHPYYVSLLAPFTAALIGAGAGVALSGKRRAKVLIALAIVAGSVTELVVLHELKGQLSWATPLVVAAGLGSAVLLIWLRSRRYTAAVVGVGLAGLLAAPAVWAADTVSHPAVGTFPAGGPPLADLSGSSGVPAGLKSAVVRALRSGHLPGGPFGGTGGLPGVPGGLPGGVPGAGAGPPAGVTGSGAGAGPPAGVTGSGAGPLGGILGGGAGAGPPAGVTGPGGFGGGSKGGFPGGPGGFAGGPPGAFGGDATALTPALHYASAHGGGTVGVASQSTAATAILSSHANAAGLGGFSGVESSVSPAWLAMQVRSGRLRWVLADNITRPRLPGDTRSGSQAAMQAVAKACRAVTLPGTSGAGSRSAGSAGAPGATGRSQSSSTLYDCRGRSAAIARDA